MAETVVGTRWIAPSARNLAAFFQLFGRRTAKWDAAWVSDSGLPEPLASSVTLLGPLDETAAQDLTARLDAFFAETGSPWIMWSAWPTPDLEPLRYQLVGHPPLMVRPPGTTARPMPDGLRIVEVREPDMLTEFDRSFIDWYPLDRLRRTVGGRLVPPAALNGDVRFWIGFVADDPVTVAAACVADGIVGVNCVATAPEARGRGFGAAITDVAARCEPTLPALLQSSDLGFPVYQRLGFETVARYTLWQRPGAQSARG
jgi:GNAT superfamily N-acetyltransferase